MKQIASFRGRQVSAQDVTEIREVISAFPDASRRFISQELCRRWDWRQANGQLKDMVCRSLLLKLERAGLIEQPPVKFTPHNPLARRRSPKAVWVDTSSLSGSLSALGPIRLEQVRQTKAEGLFNHLLHAHHYLGYMQPVGEHLKIMAWAGERPPTCLAFGSAPWYIGARDRYIGWSAEQRRERLHLIANNTRFLILPWVRVPHLASHLLARSRARLSQDWQELYGHRVHLVETFVDTSRFAGTCYQADNWQCVGQTTGRGKLSPSQKPHLQPKAVYVHPLSPSFRQELASLARKEQPDA